MLAFSRVSDFKVTPQPVIGPRRVQGRAESACTATARWFCRRKNGRRELCLFRHLDNWPFRSFGALCREIDPAESGGLR
ncbi:hypothetical protein AnigIFM49718_003184 [Aspergillus niger]|nr:hypothetical protein AnigIFM49718_003184 [Aspergillus niger]